MKSDEAVVLVTGGAGYIGSQTCKALRSAGFCPVVFDNLSTGHRWAVQWGPLYEGDLLDRAALARVINATRPGAVIHFAALAYVGDSMRDPAGYYRNNVLGTINLLQAMKSSGIDRIVFSSSCATYGLPVAPRISESQPQVPINPYGRTKLIVEQILRDCGAAHGLRSVALRYFNAAGADGDLEVGEWHDPEPHLIPSVLQAAAGQREGVTVFGEDHPTEDGTCIRDYVHVEDLAQAHVLALGVLGQAGSAQAFNLGIGRGYSVREVIDIAATVTGFPIEVSAGPARAGDPPCLVADAQAARSCLNWSPRHTTLEPMLESAWRWLQQQSAQPRH